MLRLAAWVGGLLFVAAMTYSGYVYAVVLARADEPGGTLHVLVNVALFLAFALHHTLLARPAAKRALVQLIPQSAERTVYVWAASLLWLLFCAGWRGVPGLVYDVTGIGRWPLYTIQVGGILLTIAAALAIRPLELAGIEQTSPTERPPDLRVDGLFGLVRHPIYLAWLMMVLAAPRMTVNRLLFATLTSLYLVAAIPHEERSLLNTFGERYRAYQRQVRWHLLPGIW